jgi:hypothetical protein
LTHFYTLLLGGTVISGRDEPDATAIAWTADTVIALGSDDDVLGTSRGDSHVIDLQGATVVALATGTGVVWPSEATLEVGGRADFAVLERDPRRFDASAVPPLRAFALVRSGRVVAGTLPKEIPRPDASLSPAASERLQHHVQDDRHEQGRRDEEEGTGMTVGHVADDLLDGA